MIEKQHACVSLYSVSLLTYVYAHARLS